MKKWIIRIVSFAIVIALSTYVFIDHELSKMFGGHTQLAEVHLTDEAHASVAITNVNVLEPSANNFISGQTVLIDEGTIIAIGANVDLPDDITAINGNGMFLVPGYTDSHVHLWESENDLLLYIANGVTQIREMNGSDAHLRWKKEIQEGRRLGPDMFVVAPQLASFDGMGGWFTAWTQRKTNVRSEAQIKRAAQSFKSKGYDAIKSSTFLDKAGYKAASAIMGEGSLPLVGHLPRAISLDDLWNSNQTEIAHVEELISALDREFGGYTDRNADEFLEFVFERSEDVADRLLEKGIYVTSTIWLMDSFLRQKTDLAGILGDVRIPYANPGITEGTIITSRGMGWLPNVNIYRWPDNLSEEDQQKSRTYWKTYSDVHHLLFKSLVEKGVPIMAGTDANVPVAVPGFSLHDEMKVMNEAGMSTSQVLASATSIPARWMKTNTGEISAGFKANFVLLRGNPLEDIRATDSIEMVVVDGRILSRNDLDEMLLAVLNANDNSRNVQRQLQ